MSKIALIGFPWDGGASLGRPGSRYAPKAIREDSRWLFNRIENNQIYNVNKKKLIDLSNSELIDLGDIDIVAYSYEETFKNAESKVKQAIDDGYMPFVLGGDHSISYSPIKALHDSCEGEIAIIQFDAHLDLVDDSKIQGKFSQSSQMRRALELDRVKAENIIQIGVRSFNYPWYSKYLSENPIVQFTANEVHTMPITDIINQVIEVCKRVDKVYCTFDIDVLDPAFAPGSGANESGGLTPHQCFTMLDALYPYIDAFDIAEVNPLYDPQGITASIATRIIFDCLTEKAK
ncbi:formiminoglutamase [Ureibacillus massiliensis 4400831 = CIP 108448 = CCUG 49529]|uniref:Formiminoglutamase n=1 Tax=Ureibacillus massiliensis 4400831 = CIP 108448 = CCUG 49529 TaxID=1211035 RepID=A0A0A3JZB8_9BACL|nr:agmatinase family protein [Ureibacillus massiliensis]KGR92297.1 formiminoglutamase [Ureibacillus massiliensis 4400831 = CIP 108448 = CCUG 49529]RKJ48728.1 arginase family protein [Butyricicoccus sp. 1XD8-22]